MAKIAIFSRTSTTQQDVEQQTEVLINEAKRLGYSKKQQVIIEYQESGIKLGIDERQGIKALKQAITDDHKINCVICWELTRIARRADVIYNIRDFLVEHKVRWIVLKPSFMELVDKDGNVSQTSSLMLGIFASFAESEMAIKVARFMRAKNEMTRQGKKSAGSVKFGYIKNKDKFVVADEYQSKIVNMIYRHYIDEEDTSLYETYMWMTSKWPELFPIKEYKKAQHKVRNILTDPAYLGNWCYPRIITDELMDEVKEKMSKARCKPRYNTKHNYLCRGKLYCSHCGRMMSPVGGETKAYNCVTDKTHNMTINTSNIDNLVWNDVKVIANINAGIDNNAKIIGLGNDITAKTNVRNQLIGEIEKQNIMQEKLLSLYLDNKINSKIFDDRNEKINNEIHLLNKKINKVNAEIKELEALLETTKKSDMEADTVNYDMVTDDNIKIELIRKYIDKIWVTKTDKHIYRLSFTYRNCIVPEQGEYIYKSSGGHIKIWRVNEDETMDQIV